MVSTSSSVTMVDHASVESKIEVVQSIVSRPEYTTSDTDDLQSSNAEEGDLAEGGRQAPKSTQVC